ncbi:type VI secretion system membrane subunit TssM [Pseudomonas syringae pv. syringae]|uniref:type VI secretion system membrane subunit TssM n=1 Tax=Pseudomonas TaxID=286 RepID=UPI0006B94D1A|nr:MULTISPECIES: type VI secretion system membrane subunit TssM [Pseudomonas]KPB28141.1 Type VI secretion protein IcmF [Pseudomonas syringae pv. syringae]MCK9712698.1 type VI secretion system membrane subunit TssM [Pseudomonas syringae pv. syringae]MDA7014221.1 type VI secretion system membrane subunit TssM [Pseudomonas cerasi]
MKTLFKKLMTLLGSTWFWSLLLILTLAACIWMFGPLLAMADNRFWESPVVRLATISVLLLIWGLGVVFSNWRSGWQKRHAQDSHEGQELLRKAVAVEKERLELVGRFKHALRVLKDSDLYGVLGARGRNELPWYAVIGPPGSGKTSLLDFSGLDFPLDRRGRRLTHDMRSTSSCGWYFTEQAVLLDTSGRYLQQPLPEVDGSAWSTLLELLRNRHRAHPLSGVLVTLPVDTLFDEQDKRLEKIAEDVRARLDDVFHQLHVDVPVYLVLTKADSIAGFDAFFDQLSREESEQVLGTTFRQGEQGSNIDVLGKAFDALLQRLGSQVITRIHQERDSRRRGEMLEFPNQLRGIAYRLSVFVELAFSGNRYQRASQFRGFYLTRAPQVVQNDQPSDGESDTGSPTCYSGKARFIHDLLRHVIFPEADLAVLDKTARRKIQWRQRGMCCAALLCLSVFGVLWATGFNANHDRLERLRVLGEQWAQQRSSLGAEDDLLTVLDSLNTLYLAARVFPDGDEVVLYERSGLYQGKPANDVLMHTYHAELQRQLLPRVAHMIEARIMASLGDREQLLDSLRAYLMLVKDEHREPSALKTLVATDWSVRYVGHEQAQNELAQHFERLLAQTFAYPVNDALVAQARQVLRNESFASIVYRVLRERARTLQDYSLAHHVGPQAGLLAGTEYRIPGLYTRHGYEQYFVTRGTGLVTELMHDNWVLGEGAQLNAQQLRVLMVELEKLYFRDYADYWAEAIGRVSLQPFEGPGAAAVQMAGLTAAHSPLLQLLIEVRENTLFPVLADSLDAMKAEADQAVSRPSPLTQVAAIGDKIQQTVTVSLPGTAKKSLQRRFDPLHRLLDGDNGPTPELIAALSAINELQMQMAALGRSGQPDLAAYEMAKGRMSGQRDALSNLRNAATGLAQPLGGLFHTLAEDTWSFVLYQSHQYLNQRYKAELYSFYEQSLDKRYPFYAHSSSDVALNDFREFFGSQGIADRFFDNYLKPFVNGDPGRYKLRSIDGYSLPMSRAYLDQMAGVHRIRKSFFAHRTQEPQVQFTLEPYTLDPGVRRAEFRLGEQSLEYRHGPIVPTLFKWPADAEEGRTSLVMEGMVGRPLGIEKSNGPWSLFRLLDLMQTEPLKGRDVLLLKADVGGMRANYLLSSQRAPNPFDMSALRDFRMPAQL